MAARAAPRALRSSTNRLLASNATPAVRRQAFSTAVKATTANAARNVLRPAAMAPVMQQTRSMKTMDFAGTKEVVYGMLFYSQMSIGSFGPLTENSYRAQ